MRPILAEAVDLARRALLELQPEGVGEHLGVTAEDECAATHHFAATLPGYRGWQWAVVVAAPPEAERATVSESALLPGPDALAAPEFVPWEQRVRPGDLAPGDLLAPLPNDPRLVPGYLVTGDPVVDEVVEELGQGRPQVLSREGRQEAAERWFTEYGPDTDMARAAPSTCRLCGFFVPLAGALRAAYGICANAMGADGHVVHSEYGCGAHSDTELPTGGGSPLYQAYDDAAVDPISPEELRGSPTPVADTPVADIESGAVTGDPEPAETAVGTGTESANEFVEGAAGAAVGSAAPEADVAAPDVEAPGTDVAAEADPTSREADVVVPQADAAAGVDVVAPETDVAAPEADSAAPETESAAPAVEFAADAEVAKRAAEFATAFAETVVGPAESSPETESAVHTAGSPGAESGAAEAGSAQDAASATIGGAVTSSSPDVAESAPASPAESSEPTEVRVDEATPDIGESAGEHEVADSRGDVDPAAAQDFSRTTEDDAWAVSAVRVRQASEGTSGASEPS